MHVTNEAAQHTPRSQGAEREMRKAPLREATRRPVLILPPPALTELAVVSEMKAAALGLLSRRFALRLLSCAPLAAPPVLRAFAAESEQTPSEGFITPSGLRLFDFQTGLSAWSECRRGATAWGAAAWDLRCSAR